MPVDSLPKPQTNLPLPEMKLESGNINSEPHPLENHTTIRHEVPLHSHHLLKYFLIGMFFAFAVVAVLGAYFLGKNAKSESKQVVNTVATSPSTSPDPTADWKTYDGNGFSFKYPSDLTVKQDSLREEQIFIANFDVENNKGELSDTDFAMSIESTDKKLTLDEIKKNQFNDRSVNSEFEINGIRAIKSNIEIAEGVKMTLINSIYQSKLYSFSRITGDNKNAMYFDQILTTIKFSDPKYLMVPQFNVKIPLTKGNKDAYSTKTGKSQNNTSWVYLKVHSLDSEKYCNGAASDGIASLVIVPKDLTDDKTGKKYSESGIGTLIGNYFYYIEGSQSVCSVDNSNQAIESNARKAFLNASKKIIAL